MEGEGRKGGGGRARGKKCIITWNLRARNRDTERVGRGWGRVEEGNSPKLYRRGAFVHGSSLTMVS